MCVCLKLGHLGQLKWSMHACLGLGDKCGIFFVGSGSHRKLITTCEHDCTVKYVTATRALMGGIFKILNLCEIFPVYLVDRLYLSVAVTGDRYIHTYIHT